MADIKYTKKKIIRRYYNKKIYEYQKTNFKKKINSIGIENIISIDETSIHRNTYMDIGWNPKGERLYQWIPRNKMTQKFNILMAISTNGIIEYEIYKNKNINSEIFCNFLKKISKNNPSDAFIMDNVSFHKSLLIKNEKLFENKIHYVPPYSPELNPIEEYFHELKTKVKKLLFYSNDVNKIVNKVCLKTSKLLNYFKHSFY